MLQVLVDFRQKKQIFSIKKSLIPKASIKAGGLNISIISEGPSALEYEILYDNDFLKTLNSGRSTSINSNSNNIAPRLSGVSILNDGTAFVADFDLPTNQGKRSRIVFNCSSDSRIFEFKYINSSNCQWLDPKTLKVTFLPSSLIFSVILTNFTFKERAPW